MSNTIRSLTFVIGLLVLGAGLESQAQTTDKAPDLSRWDSAWELFGANDRLLTEITVKNGRIDFSRAAGQSRAEVLKTLYAAGVRRIYSSILSPLAINSQGQIGPSFSSESQMIAAIATGAPDGDVRRRAIHLLGEIGDSAVGETLLDALSEDDDMSVRVNAAYGLIGIAETLQESPRARAILEEATDTKYLDPAANLVRYATQALERLGVEASPPVPEIDWVSIVDDQVSSRDVRAILDLALNVRAGVVLRFYAPQVQQPAAKVIGPLLVLFETDAQVAVIHGAGKGHLFARAESLYTVAREVPVIDNYRELVRELRKRGLKVGFAPSISL